MGTDQSIILGLVASQPWKAIVTIRGGLMGCSFVNKERREIWLSSFSN